MPLNIVDCPALPECGGKQWFVEDLDELAHLTALVLIGRAHHAARILEGAQRLPGAVTATQRARLRRELFPGDDVDPWHRDGLLFEVISWIVARITAGPDEVVSDPHLKSTQQGVDTMKISFDIATRRLTRATVYEYKCTDNARRKFREEVLPAFKEYAAGDRDNQLVQMTIGLLGRFGLTDDEQLQVYDRIVQGRALAFQAALTVTPEVFDTRRCVALFKDYDSIPAEAEDRLGDTFPLVDVRPWFTAFAQKVWDKVEMLYV